MNDSMRFASQLSHAATAEGVLLLYGKWMGNEVLIMSKQ